MRKIIVIAALFVGLQNVFAQQITVKDIGNFTIVKAFDKIPVELIASSESRVEILGTNNGDVNVVNKNGELKIRMTTLKLLGGDDTKVKVYYYQKLASVQASEGAVVTGNDRIEADDLFLNAKEGAKVNVNVDARNISARVNSGGSINVSGKAKAQDVVITSGGQYNGKGLSSENAKVAINAGGSADITASGQVEARTRAGGNIDIYGSPENVSQKTLAGGKITVHK